MKAEGKITLGKAKLHADAAELNRRDIATARGGQCLTQQLEPARGI
jgi:hypothetical protein